MTELCTSNEPAAVEQDAFRERRVFHALLGESFGAQKLVEGAFENLWEVVFSAETNGVDRVRDIGCLETAQLGRKHANEVSFGIFAETRATKAKKARQMDRETDAKAGANEMHYASSNSAASERSLPVTPPDTSDFDADALINYNADVDVVFTSANTTWRDTPPTSPVCAEHFKPSEGIVPAVLEGCSSPPDYGDIFEANMNLGAISTEPGTIGGDELFSDAFSPSAYGGSTDMSSPFNGGEIDDFAEMKRISQGDFAVPTTPLVGQILETWLAAN